MKTIEFNRDELKLLISILAASDANQTRLVNIARTEEKEIFNQLVTEKKLISTLLEKLIKKQ